MRLGKLFYRIVGANRYRSRGDKFFLKNDFGRARSEYCRARLAVSPSDYRSATLDALIQECSIRLGLPVASREPEETHADASFIPGLPDLFELAVSDKPREKALAYRGLGEEFQAGYVALVQGEAETAIGHLEIAANENPASFIPSLELGRALSMAGEMPRARNELGKAFRLRPKDREVINLLAAVDIQLGRFEEACELLEPLVEDRDAGPESYFLLGQGLAGLSKWDQAMVRYRQTVEMDARFHEAYFEGARILKKHGDTGGALELLNRACALVPDEITYNMEITRLVLDHELDEEVGLAACDRLMVTDEDNHWQYLAWIAELYLRRGWKTEARDPLRKALKLVPPQKSEERRALERRLAELDGHLPSTG